MDRTDFLQRYLLTLDDESFFSVMRNYLGVIRTPFNKSDLVNRLVEFLKRSETAERIVALLAPQDLRVLSAISMLGRPTRDQLVQFLGENRAGISANLVNLRDRLLIIEDADHSRIEINPVLHRRLHRDALSPRHVVEGITVVPPEKPDAPPWWTPPLAVALMAFLRQMPDLFTQNGGLRRKVQNALEERFGELFSDKLGRTRLDEALVALENLALLSREEGSIRLNLGAWDLLAELPDRWINAIIWASPLTGSPERVFEYARLLMAAIGALPPDRAYRVPELVRLLHLLRMDDALPIDSETIRRLHLTGVLYSIDPEDEQLRFNTAVSAYLEERELDPPIIVHANMEVVIPPDAPFSTAVTVARLAQLARYDLAPTYLLTRDSVSGAAREQIGTPLELLGAVAAGTIPQNVRFLITRWSERSQAIRLLDTTVLITGEEEAGVLTEFPDFMEQVQEHPSPTVFLFHRSRVPRIRELLARLGLEEMLSVETEQKDRLPIPEYDVLFRRAIQPSLTSRSAGDLAAILKATASPDTAAPGENGPQDPRPELRQTLQSLIVDEDDRQELALRIDRGLILYPEQLRGEIRSGHATEARGLDYLGKIRLIEQALDRGDMLEIIMRDSLDPERMLVRPREIVQGGEDLMLRAIREPSEEAIKIRIRRISLIRRLSGTLIRR